MKIKKRSAIEMATSVIVGTAVSFAVYAVMESVNITNEDIDTFRSDMHRVANRVITETVIDTCETVVKTLRKTLKK